MWSELTSSILAGGENHAWMGVISAFLVGCSPPISRAPPPPKAASHGCTRLPDGPSVPPWRLPSCASKGAPRSTLPLCCLLMHLVPRCAQHQPDRFAQGCQPCVSSGAQLATRSWHAFTACPLLIHISDICTKTTTWNRNGNLTVPPPPRVGYDLEPSRGQHTPKASRPNLPHTGEA